MNEATTAATAAGDAEIISFQAHRDNQRVCVEMWVVDLLDGDLAAALLFSQLLWWFQTAKGSRGPRARYERDGNNWLVRSDDGWHDDCRLTQKQVRRIRSILVEKGLVVHRRFKLNGAPTSAWRPDFDVLESLDSPDSGTSPQGAVPTAPQGVVPLPSFSDLRNKPKREVDEAFEKAWGLYPRKAGKGGAKKAFTSAARRAPFQRIVNAVWKFSRDPNLPEPQFIPHFATWLNRDGWEDDPLPPRDDRPHSEPPPPDPDRLDSFGRPIGVDPGIKRP